MNAENKQRLKRHLSIGISGLMLVFLCMLTINPVNTSALVILCIPLLVAVATYSFTRSVLMVFSTIDSQKQIYSSVFAAAGSIIVVTLGSLRQLGAPDLLFTILLIGGLVFYIRRAYPLP